MDFIEIGIVRHQFSDDHVRDHARELDGIIELHEGFADGLKGLEKRHYIFVIAVMHKHLNEKYPLRIKPRLLTRKGYRLEDLPEVGVFASDSPSRPNPLGLSLLRVDEIQGNKLKVHGLDLFDGTPIIDIKPYSARYSTLDYVSGNGNDACTP